MATSEPSHIISCNWWNVYNKPILFTVCACITIGIILIRRQMGGQELGGNQAGARGTAAFLLVLWFIYLLMSCLSAYGFLS